MYEKQEQGETVTHLSETEARGGSRTRMTRNILVVSLILVVLFFIVTVGVGYFQTDNSGADRVNSDGAAQASNSQ